MGIVKFLIPAKHFYFETGKTRGKRHRRRSERKKLYTITISFMKICPCRIMWNGSGKKGFICRGLMEDSEVFCFLKEREKGSRGISGIGGPYLMGRGRKPRCRKSRIMSSLRKSLPEPE